MTVDDGINKAKDGVALIGEIIKAAGDNKKVKEAGENLGKTAVTLTETINTCLLPLAVVNYAVDKARLYFETKFGNELQEKAADIPLENIIEPKAYIAGPVIQGLALSHEEPNLKDMYIALLATAMNKQIADDAHPAFAEIIKQLSSEEAALIKVVIKTGDFQPIGEIRLRTANNSGHRLIFKHLMDLVDDNTKKTIEISRLPVMIDNWIRLGLVEVNYTQEITDQGRYDWLDNHPSLPGYRSKHEKDGTTITIQHGTIQRTALGRQFAIAIGLIEPGH